MGSKQAASKILVVEDHVINQRVAMSQLRKLGYHADLADSGSTALSAIERACYDAILMDCQMPEMDGYEATARIRSCELPPRHTVIIALTAHAMEGDRQKCLAAGMDDYLAKPVKVKELGEMLSRWLTGEGPATPTAAMPTPAASAREDCAMLDGETIADLRAGSTVLSAELVDLFFTDANCRLAGFRLVLQRGNVGELAKLAHGLKGAAGVIGANRIRLLAATIEAAAADGALATVARLIGALEREYALLRPALELEAAAGSAPAR